MAKIGPILAFLVIGIYFNGQADGASYYGKLIGKLSELHHGVSGEVYAVDGRTLYIKDFTYDGQGPAAYFYASHNKAADKNGFRLKDESGNGEVIRRYRKEGITLTLPDGKNLHNIKIFYLWCEEFDVNFGDVKIPRNFDYPKPQKIEGLKGVHGVSSDNVVIVDAQTILIPNFSYDGEAPDAKFWVGKGPKPSPQGIRVPDENGKENPLRRYDRKTVVLTLPGDLTIFDIGHFGIWCEAFTVDFGHVQIPQGLNIPPSLKMLGVSPQKQRQHHHHEVDVQVSHSRQLIGGHLQPTTFRPPKTYSLFTRRNDALSSQVIPTQGLPHPNSIQKSIEPLEFNRRSQQQVGQPQTQIIQLQRQLVHPHPQLIQPQQVVYHPFGQIQQLPQNFALQSHSVIIQPSQQTQHFGFGHQGAVQHQLLPQSQQSNSQQVFNYQQIPGHQPLNPGQRAYEDQIAFNQYVQNKKLQEEQLRQQLSRQHNRFNLVNNNQHLYVPLG